MATARQVQSVIKRFVSEIDDANSNIRRLTETIQEMEEALETFNEDEDLEISRSIRGDIDRSKRQITELRENIQRLEREIGDTNRKLNNLRN